MSDSDRERTLSVVAVEDRGNDRKRRRAAHACDICRQRKIRCDGRQPCSTCTTSRQSCVYGAEAASKGKSDLILEGVMRLEQNIREMKTMIGSISFPVGQQVSADSSTPQTVFSADLRGSPHQDRRPSMNRGHEDHNVHNAILSSMHTSTTESVLEWPHFDMFPSLRANYTSIFVLEQSRPPLTDRPSIVTPYLGVEEVRQIIQSFQSSVNFFYPTMSKLKLESLQILISTGNLDSSVESCLALLIMALGCASQSVRLLFDAYETSKETLDYRQSRRALAEMYFDGVLKRLHVAHLELTTEATQCLFFTALYFAYLQRPLQAWTYISTTAARCRLLLSHTSVYSPSDVECVRRIFWSCYILESDYLAELAALPQSGIADIESSIPLPGQYKTTGDSNEEEQSSLYFLACLSMRRLLNRVHDLLYARDTGAGLDVARFPFIATELDHQLEEWRDLLPPAFRFSVDTQPTPTHHGGFLRQRYLTCRSVIYRPYLTWVLANRAWNGMVSKDVLEKCGVCLNACVLHILNLRGFCHTVMIDTWICSLSMASAMLILLAASRVPSLQDRLGPDVTTLGAHLKHLIGPWMHAPGSSVSPSVGQSLRLIDEIDGFLKLGFHVQAGDQR